jgi:diaminopimelate dehydrogenase
VKIKVGIVGWGNLGKGVRLAIQQNPDMELVSVFTRRDPSLVGAGEEGVHFLNIDKAKQFTDRIDVMVLCGSSANDLFQQGPYFAGLFNTVDSFDTHAKIPEYYAAMDQKARANGKTTAISIGWDPGLFSLNRLISEAVLPQGKEYTFWGFGVSQGHSAAIRKLEGVKDGVQYTIPFKEALEKVRNGENPTLLPSEKHLRHCYIVAEEGADKEKIRAEIQNMPHYFADYETKVFFISAEEMAKKHAGMPHGGFVIRSGQTGEKANHNQIMEFSLKLESNPEFTSSVLLAYARAVFRLNREGNIGAKTIFDIPPRYLSLRSPEDLRRELL